MKWILIDLAIALLALAVLAVLVLGLWRRVKALGSTVARAGEAVAQASEALAVAQGDGPLGATQRSPAAGPQGRHVRAPSA